MLIVFYYALMLEALANRKSMAILWFFTAVTAIMAT